MGRGYIQRLDGTRIKPSVLAKARRFEATVDEILLLNRLNLEPNGECGACEESWLNCLRSDQCRVEDARFAKKLDKLVCYYCYESDSSYPEGTAIIFDPEAKMVDRWTVYSQRDELRSAVPMIGNDGPDFNNLRFDVGTDDEISPIQFSYRKTDAWRGSHEPTTTEYEPFHTDGILGYSANEQKLKRFHDLILKLLWAEGIKFAVCIGTTSNIFYQTYDLKTLGPVPPRIERIKDKLARILRDPGEYNLTAITGKSKDWTDSDKLLTGFACAIFSGEDVESLLDRIVKGGGLNED